MIDNTSAELEAVRAELDTLRRTIAADVDSGWTSAWKSPDTVDAKVRARLAGNKEYQALRVRIRELEKGSAP